LLTVINCHFIASNLAQPVAPALSCWKTEFTCSLFYAILLLNGNKS